MQSAAAERVGLRDRITRLLAAQPGEMTHIDFVRFVAAMAIMVSHSFELFLPAQQRPQSHEATSGLTLFVDVFFVLSGFVISHIYAGRLHTVPDFLRYMQKRIARLVPLHWATLLCATALYASLDRFGAPLNTRPDMSTACLSAAAALVQSWIDCGGIPPNGASWSISVEMVMYCAFPAFLAVLALARPMRVGAFVLILVGCAWLAGGVHDMSEGWTPLRAAPAFFLGALLFRERTALSLRVPSSAPLLACLALVAGSFAMVPRPVLLAVAYLTAAVAIVADQRTEPNRLVRRGGPLGQLSYSIYMLHGPVRTIMANGIAHESLASRRSEWRWQQS